MLYIQKALFIIACQVSLWEFVVNKAFTIMNEMIYMLIHRIGMHMENGKIRCVKAQKKKKLAKRYVQQYKLDRVKENLRTRKNEVGIFKLLF